MTSLITKKKPSNYFWINVTAKTRISTFMYTSITSMVISVSYPILGYSIMHNDCAFTATEQCRKTDTTYIYICSAYMQEKETILSHTDGTQPLNRWKN